MLLERWRMVWVVVIVIAALASCTMGASPEGSAETTPVNLYLSFQPDVQFAPFYVAIEQGMFAEQGLDVTIAHQAESEALRLVGTAGSDGPLSAAVVSGEQVLLARAQDIPVIYVFAWYQDFPIAIASKTEQGILTMNDLGGHSVGVPMLEGASYIGLQAMLTAGGLSESDIELQATGFTQVETLAADRVDAVVVYASNEPVQLEAAGIDVNIIYAADVVDLVSNGLVVNEADGQNRPDLVRRLVAALGEAVQYAIDHPDEAFEASKQHVEGLNDPEIEAAQREVLARSIDLWKADRLGESQIAAWLEMQDVLVRTGLLAEPGDVEAAFTNEFLP